MRMGMRLRACQGDRAALSDCTEEQHVTPGTAPEWVL